jgi:hypothetical protein
MEVAIQLKSTAIDTPFSGKISAKYIHVIGPSDN